MSPAFIIDSSITMAWCFLEEQTEATAEVRDRLDAEAATAPAIWLLEVTNVLFHAEKRGRITPSLSSDFLEVLQKMTIEVDYDGAARCFEHVLPLCRRHHLTAYDAAYLELAIRTGLPLATLDGRLRAAAPAHGIDLLGI
jgi:predicted nucleic acid-binding protein